MITIADKRHILKELMSICLCYWNLRAKPHVLHQAVAESGGREAGEPVGETCEHQEVKIQSYCSLESCSGGFHLMCPFSSTSWPQGSMIWQLESMVKPLVSSLSAAWTRELPSSMFQWILLSHPGLPQQHDWGLTRSLMPITELLGHSHIENLA